ncbi:unnamed protein product [Nippostrongylus brasiliensis]|uniref:Uncharacterized protein n=1 Tax=Nippostrongylus brasiliensis TaxID=27835 RepID=A0A0N4XS81_NIPBR|nr:unnamed protein product [Nippostrongylus brasiliensis]
MTLAEQLRHQKRRRCATSLSTKSIPVSDLF